MSDVYRDDVSALLERVLRNAKRRRVATLLLEELYDREGLRHIADGRGKYSGCRPGGATVKVAALTTPTQRGVACWLSKSRSSRT